MPSMKQLTSLTLIASGLSSFAFTPTIAYAEDALIDALTGGKVSFSARARYENVEDEGNDKQADAYTLRTTLGYKTGAFHGFSGFIEFEDVTHLGSDRFNAAGTNGEPTYPIVADPEGTEVNQAYLAYSNFDTTFKFGRQIITYRDAPFHRYIGTVGWRQNWQTFDALSIVNTSLPNTTFSYAYVDKVQSIFGSDGNVASMGVEDGDIEMDSHFFNAQYSGLAIGNLEGYAYLLDYEDMPDNSAYSRATYGARLSGAQALNEAFKIVYSAEYATQDDYAEGEMEQQDYSLLELGGKYKGWLLKLSHEVQEGDGVTSFRTPLGTNHAYQGWADKFLLTPAQGLEDTYVTLVGDVLGAKLVAVYHDFETDEDSLDAGDEFDIMLAKTFNQHYTLGVKYADYNADNEFGGVDTEKFWLWGEVKF